MKEELEHLGAAPEWEGIPTEDEVVAFCLAMEPKLAAVKGDSGLCVTPLISRMIVNGDVVDLNSVDGQWLAALVRVSRERQRSAESKKKKKTRKVRYKEDGFSEEEQVRRAIRYCLEHRLAFRIYSDCGVTGEFPSDEPALIARLLKKKAARFRRSFEKVLLDDSSISRRTPVEVASLKRYVEKRVETIMRIGTTEEEAFATCETDGEAKSRRARRGRHRRRVYHRQGFSQCRRDIQNGRVHTVGASDRSRIARDADMETEFLEQLHEHGVRLVGFIEDMSGLDVSDPFKKGLNYLIASVNEARLSEITTNVLRGQVQRLESGRHTGRLSWWFEEDEDGNATLVPENVAIVHKILGLYLGGRGITAIATRLIEDGDLVKGIPLTHRQVVEVIDADTITGKLPMFGLLWPVLPAAVTDSDLLAELQQKRAERGKKLPFGHACEWAEHLFSGLLRCSCGEKMAFQGASPRERWRHPAGYYRCRRPNQTARGEKGQHAAVDASQLEAFVEELISGNSAILSGLVLGDLATSNERIRQANRALVERAVGDAERKLAESEQIAHETARERAELSGLKPGEIGYDEVVSGIARNLVAPYAKDLEVRRAELFRLKVESNKQVRHSRLLDAVKELGGWIALDTVTKNRLLRSVFDHFVVFPRRQENKITMRLNGVKEPLAPIIPRHYSRYHSRLPTVAEWLDDTYGGLAEFDAVAPASVRGMKPIYQYRKEMPIEGSAEFWDWCKANHVSASHQRTYQWYRKHMAEKHAPEGISKVFEAMWAWYREKEYERLLAPVNLGNVGADCLSDSTRIGNN